MQVDVVAPLTALLPHTHTHTRTHTGASAFSRFAPNVVSRVRSTSKVSMTAAPPGYKPSFDGTFKKAGEFLDEYVLEMDNGSRAVVRSYGGNCFTYKTKDGIEVMGTRKDAPNPQKDEKPYAGGAPHCWPQFGPGAIMQHGFARGMKFIPEERAKKMSFDRMIFKLLPTEETRKVWDHDFEYRFDITLRADCLEWELIVMNLGDKPYDYTMGLHNYFDVSSLKNVVIEGPFTGAETMDRNNKNAAGKATSDKITITAPVDMLFKGVSGAVSIIDSGKKTKTTIERKGFPDTCIWNPVGDEKMGWDNYVCVEPVCNSPVTAPVGKFKETHYYQKVSCVKI